MTKTEAAATLGITVEQLEAMRAGIAADKARIAGGTWTTTVRRARRNPVTGIAEWVEEEA